MLIHKYKPKSLDEMILNPATRKQLENLTKNKLSFILSGPAGCGKNCFVDILTQDIEEMNLMWVDPSKQDIDWIKKNVERFSAAASVYNSDKYVVFNEADKLHIESMPILKTVIERYNWNRYVFITNHIKKIKDEALISRLVTVEFKNPVKGDVFKYLENILISEGVELNHQTNKIINKCLSKGYTDFRKILNELENNL